MEILRTTSEHQDFQKLVLQLNQYLAQINGEENDFFAQYNHIDDLKHVVIIFSDHQPIGCGAIKEYDSETMEIKRMFVDDQQRGQGVGSKIISELEKWAKELGYTKCILETSIEMKDAIHLYQKNDYQIISNYGQYINVDSSVCFEKQI